MEDNKIQRVGTYGYIKNDNEEVLMVKRSDEDSYPGLWELPGGGVDFGEDPKEAVKREIKEETNLDVEVLLPVKILSHVSDDKQRHTIRIVFSCRLLNKKQKVKISPEHSGFKWSKI